MKFKKNQFQPLQELEMPDFRQQMGPILIRRWVKCTSIRDSSLSPKWEGSNRISSPVPS